MKKIFVLLATFFLVAPAFIFAAEIQESGTAATVDKSQTPKNLYIASQTVNVDGNVLRDLHAAANAVNVNGNVEQSANVVGSSVTVKGNVGNNLRAGGKDIVVQGNVGGDVLAIGGIVVLEKSSTVSGDILAVGGTIELNGKILGDVRIGGAEKVIIRGQVDGFVWIEAVKDLKIEDTATIGGKLTYKPANAGSIANEQNIKGGVEYKKVSDQNFALNFKQVWYWSAIVKSIVLLVVLLILVYLVPRFARNFVNETYKNIWPNLGWGAFTLFVIPLIGLALLLTFVGAPFAFLLGLLWLFLAILAGILSSLAIGSWIMKLVNKEKDYTADWKAVVVGIVAAFILQLIPIVGPLVLFVFFLFALGELALTVWGQFKRQRKT